MQFNFYGKIKNKIQNYGKRIDQLELNVLDERQNFKEIFERNIVLEKEISERTEELNQANKSLLTLKHIWSTMNSSEPLSEVLTTVVNGLTDEMGYLHSFIVQIQDKNDQKFVRIRAENNNAFSEKINSIINTPLNSFDIPFEQKENVIIKSIINKSVYHIKSFKQLLVGANPVISDEVISNLDEMLSNRCITILPIVVQDKQFGSLIVFSIRSEISSTEKNFLSLFVDQIELAVRIADLFEQIREQAITDGLTGLFNRRHFDHCLSSEAERAVRLKQPFTLISLDLDHLKFINDNLGHSAGDAAICHIGKILKQNARSVDIPARFGGEEFAVILPGIDIEGGKIAAERLRSAIASNPVEGVGTITASIGVATFLRHADSISELLEFVDQALYRAKRNGRNQVQIATNQNDDWQFLVLDAFIESMIKRRIPISPAVAANLIIKVKSSDDRENCLSEFLYYVIDSIAQTYNKDYKNEFTQEKIDASYQIAQELKLSKEVTKNLVIATLLHDLGTMTVPEKILLKPGPLTGEEKTTIHETPINVAKDILQNVDNNDEILNIVKHHYEKWDGSGFPQKLSGDEIPTPSRIMSIIDAYFAMISDRPHRKALSKKEAINILLEGANKTWDGKIVKIFVKILEDFDNPKDKKRNCC